MTTLGQEFVMGVQNVAERAFSVSPPRYRLYELSCLQAGHSVTVKWSERRARLEMVAARFRCGIDGSAILISECELLMHTEPERRVRSAA